MYLYEVRYLADALCSMAAGMGDESAYADWWARQTYCCCVGIFNDWYRLTRDVVT